ncbi:MAG: hypothetical protein HN742_33950 [Lentisphaerae bacterium]|jgi:hypothetical protein|nr:hypothetical protein [Lentisphaerota bacterium]MBT4817314.1 hypothetical protein [Lentisphaerota bacterium]MBT5611468.1 hypothetical protein [Lentisphaerota bacterium]MBT7061017.1 hypothetical protein [Lentisphaerota bacterium]MBT7846925.1 hypothetical protein [Lentisphaerota bacterium]
MPKPLFPGIRNVRRCMPNALLGMCGIFLLQVMLSPPASAGKPPSDSRAALHWYSREYNWLQRQPFVPLKREDLIASAEAAQTYMLNHQTPAGSFAYQLDMVLKTYSGDDSAVRQAGALWAIASLSRMRPSAEACRGAILGLDFFFQLSRALPSGTTAPVYPGSKTIKTGMVALNCLSLVDFMRSKPFLRDSINWGFYDSWLTQYLNYLEGVEMGNGSWCSDYLFELNEKEMAASPYYDGEALLAYCRAARYANRNDLIPKIEAFAPRLAERYTVGAWEDDPGSDATKGFFQWGCMAFAEYVEAGWKDADAIGDAAMALAWWVIHQHRVQLRRGNTAYAVEGLLGAYRVAKARGDRDAMAKLHHAAESILSRLITWQAGGPKADKNPFLVKTPVPVIAIGGIMSSKDSGIIRIDVVQHQLHATLMALELLFPAATPAPRKP